jgi:tRNA threonylcarbamoyladenosine biosynthesis protein TsaE
MFGMVTGSEKETRDLGVKLGRLLRPGDFVALYGDLGSGKTRFAQGVARGLGVAPGVRVTSPTYTILNEYQGEFPLYHFDLYRLDGDTDISELGFGEYFAGNGVCLVEWAERMAGEFPDEYLKIFFYHEEGDTRRIEFDWSGDRYGEIVRKLLLPG